ncbi:unnamed protein product, partial [Scytosiphon promiscuus]
RLSALVHYPPRQCIVSRTFLVGRLSRNSRSIGSQHASYGRDPWRFHGDDTIGVFAPRVVYRKSTGLRRKTFRRRERWTRRDELRAVAPKRRVPYEVDHTSTPSHSQKWTSAYDVQHHHA